MAVTADGSIVAVGSASLANNGWLTLRSTDDGASFVEVHERRPNETPQSVELLNSGLLAFGVQRTTTPQTSAWNVRTSSDNGATWSGVGGWFSEGGGNSRANFGFEIPGVAGYFVAGSSLGGEPRLAGMIAHVNGAGAPEVVHSIRTERNVMPSSYAVLPTIELPDGSVALMFREDLNGRTHMRSSRNGRSWTSPIDAATEDAIRLATFAHVGDAGDLYLVGAFGEPLRYGIFRLPARFE